MSTAVRILIAGLVVGLLAACASEGSLNASGNENDTSLFGRIGSVLRF